MSLPFWSVLSIKSVFHFGIREYPKMCMHSFFCCNGDSQFTANVICSIPEISPFFICMYTRNWIGDWIFSSFLFCSVLFLTWEVFLLVSSLHFPLRILCERHQCYYCAYSYPLMATQDNICSCSARGLLNLEGGTHAGSQHHKHWIHQPLENN